MAEIIWSKFAIEDLKNIYDFIATDSSFYAKRQINKLSERVSQLIKFPNSGRIVPEFNKTSIRELIEGNYRIVYNINGEKIEIVRIHHSSKSINPD